MRLALYVKFKGCFVGSFQRLNVGFIQLTTYCCLGRISATDNAPNRFQVVHAFYCYRQRDSCQPSWVD
ncbi:uncharacterized protein PHALS_13107 [Plasmopara halstedii]|uniref:Uncharacterized protein n=1 Tax=Plasmopara halstedii TaxID=4781 RepID=A0A0P1AN30_PLAHL|nr:uncharacterized protein PHALS_13107 [Plasmopara halstedii]CEG42870.1 hypothetical protein PHALS_13107 [Plasmopara halstedii]|eukprot:XP_024579239.1 hypothetical protein PHALS_13107 [Plasmopara halstedii]